MMSGNCAARFSYSSTRERVDFQIYPIKDNEADSGEKIKVTISESSNTFIVPNWASIDITIND